ncbi:uncharacterized protein [Magallana gigas]|uniref:uncharacterized protein isoform X3 n=1 Tax=Magallana gigas TaxID=29159 RepID=UPI00333F508D
MLDNDNKEKEKGILTNKASRNTSLDMENNVKKRKVICYDTANLNHDVIQLDIKPKPRPLPDIPSTKQRASPLLQIHLPEERRNEPLYFPKGKTPVKVIYTKDQGTMTKKTYTKKQATQTKVTYTKEIATQTIKALHTEKQHKSLEGKKTPFIVLCARGIIMVAAIVLISTSEEISEAKPCDLEKALKSISVDYNFPCKYHAIKEKTTNLRIWGIFLWILNFIYFILILIYLLLHQLRKLLHPKSLMPKKFKRALFFLNFVQLKATMFNSLEKNFTSDNISSNDAVSNSWNKFFIEYECCAINQVQGTTNDFDSTPWCTTSGSCQATASQIPKTCCNYVTEDDYGSAPSNCHSSVNSGTYKSNCMNAIKRLSVTNIEEYKISLLQVSLLIIGTLEIAESILVLVLTTEFAIFFKFK